MPHGQFQGQTGGWRGNTLVLLTPESAVAGTDRDPGLVDGRGMDIHRKGISKAAGEEAKDRPQQDCMPVRKPVIGEADDEKKREIPAAGRRGKGRMQQDVRAVKKPVVGEKEDIKNTWLEQRGHRLRTKRNVQYAQ